MLNTPSICEDRVTTSHRAKLAYIYVRQSTAGQVRQHQESTELQYRLVDRAILFGWPKERVEVIDDDLGKSGASSDGRYGFQRLIGEIGLGKAGLVLSLDASRLARNNRDWHQLLELCSLFGVLIADGERLYDPCTYHDRLLLGLSGIMSEAELHQIKVRLHQGERQKAARGELRMPLPAGLCRGRDGRVVLNPDEEVQARLLILFGKFRELRSAKAVMRYLQQAGLRLPVRPLRGPAPHEVVWRPADNARVLDVLKNPAYSGTYVYGRRRRDPIGRRSGARHGRTVAVAPQDWPICLKDAYPGYISWEEFMANQRRLADNLGRYAANRPGVPRKGNALLQGIVVCGRCGRHMYLGTPGRMATIPSITVRPTSNGTVGGVARRSALWGSMVKWNGWRWRRSLPIGSPWPSPPWASSRKRLVCSSANGPSNANAPGTRLSEPAGNTMRWSRRTGWSRVHLNARGRRDSARSSRLRRSMRAGVASSPWCSPMRIARRSYRWGRICRACGMPRPRRSPSASRSCAYC
jgi:DNA invertase Pin-like site-specific DNA recombinase